MRYMRYFTDFVFKFRKTIIAIVIAVTLFFGWQLTNLKVNSDVLSFLPKTDSAAVLYNRVGDLFSGNELALVVIEGDNVFSPGTIKTVASITDKLKSIDGIATVTSLTDIMDIKDVGDGSLDVGKLIDMNNIPDTQEKLDALKKYALSKDLYDGRIVSHDGKSTVVACLIKKDADKKETTKLIRNTVNELKVPEKIYFGGAPFIVADLGDVIFSDLKTLIPIVAILIILTLYISFGTVRGVVIPLLSVLVTNIWVLGLMSLLKVPLTIISDVIPVILIAIGTAPTIHILSKYDEDKSRYGATDDKAKEAFSEVGWRVILTSLTIVFGFVSFIFGSYLTMIKEFGIFTSIGVMLMLIVSVMFVPAVLSFVKVRDDKPGDRQKKGGKLITRGMNIIGDFVFKNEKAIIIGSLLIFVVGIAFIPKIVRKVDIVDFFKPNHKVHDTERIIKDNFGGSRPIQVLVNGDMQDPYVLKEMRLLSKYLNYLPNVSNAQSVAALVAQMNGVMDKNDVIPDSRDKVTNLWFFLDGQEIMPQLVDSDKQNGLVQALFKNMDLKSMNDNLKQIDDYIKNTPNELVVVEKKALKGSDRDIAYSCGIKSVAQSIIWDAGNRDLSQHKDPEGLEDALKNCKNDPAKMSAAALAMFPQELAANERFVKDVQNDIAELKQENMALPKTIYNAMSAGKPAPLEEVSFKMDYTGIPLIYQHLDQSLLKSQVESLLYAVVFIYILLLFQLKSFVGAFFGLSPILLIISVMFGVMGLTGIPLDVATVLAASIALGIGIDYSIHFSVRFRNNYKEIPDHLQALDATLDTTGRAIVINVLAVTMGFITLIFAKLVPLNRFGILVAITMIGSGIGALTLLPSLFLVTKGKFIGSLTRIKNKMKEMNKK